MSKLPKKLRTQLYEFIKPYHESNKLCDEWKKSLNVIETFVIKKGFTHNCVLLISDTTKKVGPDSLTVMKIPTLPRSSTGFFGVTLDKNANRYKATLYEKNTTHHIGYYDTAEDAAIGYNSFVISKGFKHPLNLSCNLDKVQYHGVKYSFKYGVYYAKFWYYNQIINLGRFFTAEEAAYTYDAFVGGLENEDFPKNFPNKTMNIIPAPSNPNKSRAFYISEGVASSHDGKLFSAEIWQGGKPIRIGIFDNLEDAKYAYSCVKYGMNQ